MKVFISWSGIRSLKVAEFMQEWLKCVLQSVKPWVSSQNLDRGSVWFTEISEQLKDTSVGIICLTAENKEKPWIMFEAGALAKGLSTSRICPFLIDLESSEVKDPLGQLNLTTPDREGVYKLVNTLNSSLGEKALENTVLRRVFETYWPQFEEGFAAILEAYPQTEIVHPRDPNDILSEILDHTRALGNRLTRLEGTKLASTLDAITRGNVKGPSTQLSRKVAEMVSNGLDTNQITRTLGMKGYSLPTIMSAIYKEAGIDPDQISADS